MSSIHTNPPRRWGKTAATRVFSDILRHRAEQDAQYGDNAGLLDGTGPETRWLLPFTKASAESVEEILRQDYEGYEEETGAPTWVHLLREEFAEVCMEDDPVKLREEILQLVCLGVKWIERLDERA